MLHQAAELTAAPSDMCGLVEQGKLSVVGRFEPCASGALRLSWSGAGLRARFSGTGLRMTHKGPTLRYAVVVDGKQQADLLLEEGTASVTVVHGLPPAEHEVQILRQGEALFGVSAFTHIEALDGVLLSAPAAPARRLEIYGDSISCGYGNEGKDTSCGFSLATENHFLSYGGLLSRELSADLSTIAWSGRGVVRNYNGEVAATLVDLAELALPQENKRWQYPSQLAPDAVLINLGTNDYSTEPDPQNEDFIEQYVKLLAQIRKHYPQTFIVCTIGPLLGDEDLKKAQANIEQAVTRRHNAGDPRVASHAMQTTNEHPGCDWHPGLVTHQKMAHELAGVLRGLLHWN